MTLAVALPAVVLAAVLASRVPGPALLWDGQGYLGAARWVARDDWPFLGDLKLYHPAYGGLLAPSIWLGASPMGLFRWAQAVNVLSIVVCALALGALARQLVPERWVTATAAACATPALAVQAGLEWPEVPTAAAFALATLFAWRERYVGLALASVALYALHPRGLGVVAVTIVLLVVQRRWLAVALAVLGTAGVQLLNQAAVDALYDPDRESMAGAAFSAAVDVGTWPDIAANAIGHTWYLLCATAGLALVAVIALARDRRPAARWLLGAVVAVLAASAIQLIRRGRADHAVYGRYLETIAPVLVIVAARHLRPRPFVAAIGSVVLLALGVVAADSVGLLDGHVAYINVPVLAALDGVHSGPGIDVAFVTTVAVAITAVLALVAWRTPNLALVLVAVAGLTAANVTHDDEIEGFAVDAARTYRMADEVARFAPDGVVAFDVDAYDMLAANRYQWEQPQLTLDYWRGGAPPSDTIVARKGLPPVTGAKIAAIEPARDLVVWIAPGRLHDELAREHWLVLDHGEPFDDSFHDARLERLSSRRVRLTHAGGSAPWVPDGALPGDVGLVRVLADGDAIPLPAMVRPGESVVVEVPAGTSLVELEHVHHGVFAELEL